MKITLTWTPAGASRPSVFTLVDSPASVPMTNLRINGTRTIQGVKLFRATAETLYDRGNRKTQITFETTRLFDNQTAAEQFLLDHETMFPGQFLVTFYSGSGSLGVTRYLNNAVVENMKSSIRGFTTQHTYRITAGVISATST